MIVPIPEVIEKIKSINGALSVCEAIAIMTVAKESPKGVYMELGVFNGKSAMSAAHVLEKGTFILVDPMFEQEEVVNQVSKDIWGINDKHTYAICPGLSWDEIPKHNRYSYVMVDSGSHQDGIPMREVKLLEDRLISGGIIAFHDLDSQFREVREAYDYLVSTGKYEPIPINWEEIVEYVKGKNLEFNNQSWHHNEIEFPCFFGAVKRK